MCRVSGHLQRLAVVAVLALGAMPTHAQPFDRTFVRSDGSDVASCGENLGNPCLTINRGVMNVADGGTVNVLDANSQSPFFVNKDVSIFAGGGQNIVQGEFGVGGPSSGMNIAPSAGKVVTISGVGVDVGGSYFGLSFSGAGTLHIDNCMLRGSLAEYGINIIPNGPSEIYISNCVIADNGGASTGGGILIKPTGSASVKVVIEDTRVENNQLGIAVDGRETTGDISVTIRDSVVSGNSTFGLAAAELGGGEMKVMVEGSTVSDNGGDGIAAYYGARVRVRNSTVRGGRVLDVGGGGLIFSHGGNVLEGFGAFTSTVPQQ